MRIPAHIKTAIRELGLRTQDETLQVLASDDLELAVKHAAETAAYHGNSGQWWRLWLDMQDALGRPVEEALSAVDPRSLRWLGRWAANEKRLDVAVAALTRYHDQAEGDDPHAADITTIAELLLDSGEYERLKGICDRIRRANESSPTTEAFAILACGQTNGEDQARAEMIAALTRYPNSSILWLVKAMLESANPSEVADSLEVFAKAGATVSDSFLRRAAVLIPNLRTRLNELSSYYGQPWSSTADQENEANWLAARGARPCPTEQETPHWFGGDYFLMPKCVGCGLAVTQFFVIEPAAEPTLASAFPSWSKLPFFSCQECGMQLGRNDFVVHWSGRRIEWVAHELNPKRFGIPYLKNAVATVLPKKWVSLRWLPPASSRDEVPHDEQVGDPPQVGGYPDWVQFPEQPYCPKCHEKMSFYGALGSTRDFPAEMMVNNGSGYLYHFACDSCYCISIISQCT